MITSEERISQLEQTPVGRLLFTYALPAVVGTMVNALYNIVDRIFIGQCIGGEALTGLGVCFPLMLTLQAFGMLVGAGAGARTSLFIGEKDIRTAQSISATALYLTLIIQFFLLVPAFIFMKPLLSMFGASSETMPYAVDYLKYIIPGNIFATLTFSFNNIMRASGYPKRAMWTMIIGAIINIVLDPIFIIYFDWGIDGAAISTVISMVITSIFVMVHYLNKNSIVHFTRDTFHYSSRLAKSILILGIPPFAVQIVGSVTSVIVNKSFVAYSPDVHTADMNIGAYTIMVSIVMLIVMFVLGVSQGMQPIVGFSYGAKNYFRALRCYKCAVFTNLTVTVIGFVIVMVYPTSLVRCFTSDPHILDISVHGMRLGMLGFFAVGFQITSGQFMQATGKAKVAILISMARRVIILIPVLLILPYYIGVRGVWLSNAIADILSAVLTLGIIIYQVKKIRRQALQL